MQRFIPLVIALVVVAAAVAGGVYWLRQYESVVVIDIDSGRVPETELPVYAQFVVTQTLELAEPAEVTGLEIPFHVQDSTRPLIITLRARERAVQAWQLSEVTRGSTDEAIYVELPLEAPRVLAGPLTVTFDGSEISSLEKDVAPRVFVEKFDGGYEPGHYRIADNDKEGDVSLRVLARETRLEQFKQAWQDNPLKSAQRVGMVLLILVLLWALPFVFVGR